MRKLSADPQTFFYPLNTLNENNQKKIETKSVKEETKNKTMELRMVQMTKNGKYKNSENFLHKNMRLSITYTHRNNTHKHTYNIDCLFILKN